MRPSVLRHHADGYVIVAVASGEVARLEPFHAVPLDVAVLFGRGGVRPPMKQVVDSLG